MGITPGEGQYVVIGQKGTGSVAIEAALTLIGQPWRREEVLHAQFAAHNPMVQVPVLITPSGETLTESAAILLWLAETHPEAALAPVPGAPQRAQFLRWMAFVSASIYAHCWVIDGPARVTTDPGCQIEVKAALEARVAANWGVMEANISPGRYLLGEELTVLDLYVTVVSSWTPRTPLHGDIAPRLGEVVRRVEGDPRLAALWAERLAFATME